VLEDVLDDLPPVPIGTAVPSPGQRRKYSESCPPAFCNFIAALLDERCAVQSHEQKRAWGESVRKRELKKSSCGELCSRSGKKQTLGIYWNVMRMSKSGGQPFDSLTGIVRSLRVPTFPAGGTMEKSSEQGKVAITGWI